ncbi:MAG: hypothetical protein ABI528_08770, partial [bacterium]
VVFISFGYTSIKIESESMETVSEFNNESKINTAINTNLHKPMIFGDINGDGLVDLEDMKICENEAITFCTGSCQADLNNDSVVDLVDLSILSNLLCSYL